MRASVLVRQPASEDLPPLCAQHWPAQGKATFKDTLPASELQFCQVLGKLKAFEGFHNRHQQWFLGLITGCEWGVGEVVGVWIPEKFGCEEGAHLGNPRGESEAGDRRRRRRELLEQEQEGKEASSCHTAAAGGGKFGLEERGRE